jgi:4-hydroxybenzoate polyprenyltransferase
MKLFDYVFLTRPMLIIPVWTIALLGARAAEWRSRGTNPFILDRYPFVDFSQDDRQMLLTLLMSTLLAGGIFILNQIFDVESDRRNKKLFLIADGHVSPTEAWVLYILTTTVAIVGAFLVNWQLGFLFVVGALVGLQYSLPWFNLREHPYKSFRNNMIGHGTLAFLFGWVMTMKAPDEFTNFNLEGIIKSLPYVLAVGAVYLNTTLPDLEGDKAVGKKTYPMEWGLGRTLRISFWMTLVAVVFAILFADYAFALAAAISLPFFATAWMHKSLTEATLATKVSILALSLFAAIYFPPYLAIVLLVVVATRIYYAARFSIKYPVLTGKSER